MRKMTYQEAATCGENLKARVTPEQSEKLQKAWFAAGKEWEDDSTDIAETNVPYLFLCETLGNCETEIFFRKHPNTEIELIDDLPQHDFASQQEVWEWLTTCNRVKRINGHVFGFKNGLMWDFTSDNEADICFIKHDVWQKYTPPRLIRVNGIEVPAPLESLKSGERFWLIDLNSKELALELSILDTTNDDRELWLKHGLLYATKEGAIKRANAMLKFEVVE